MGIISSAANATINSLYTAYTAGAALARNDLAVLWPDGKAYPAGTADYVIAPVGNILAQTQIMSVPFGSPEPHMMPLLRLPDGTLLIVTPWNASTQGLTVWKYSATGASLGSYNISTAAAVPYNVQIFLLSNGNVCVTYTYNSASYTAFSIFTQALSGIASNTTLSAVATYGSYTAACALAGGGFVYVFRNSSGALQFQVLNNSGNQTVTATTINGTNQTYAQEVSALPNGNFVVSYYAGDQKHYHAIYTAAGVQVLAPTLLTSYNSGVRPRVSVLPSGQYGLLCMSAANTWATYVFDSTGTQQGSASSVTGASNAADILNDGSKFWVTAIPSSSTTVNVVSLTSGGVASANSYAAGASIANPSLGIGLDGSNLLVLIGNNGGASLSYCVINTASSTTLVSSTTVSSGSSNCNFPSVVGCGDGVFAAAYDYGVGTYFQIVKYTTTNVAGLVTGAAAAGSTATVLRGLSNGSSSYTTNTLRGTPGSKSFDASASTGAKGSLTTTSLTLAAYGGGSASGVQFTTGAAISAGQLVQLSPAGKAIPAVSVDGAATSTGLATMSAVKTCDGTSQWIANGQRITLLPISDGSYITTVYVSGATYARKYDRAGNILASVSLTSNMIYHVKGVMLVDGMVAFIGTSAWSGSGMVFIATIDPSTMTIKGWPTSIGVQWNTMSNGCAPDIVALSGGGFAIAYVNVSGAIYAATYSSSAAQVIGASYITTANSSYSSLVIRMIQLTDGKIVVVWNQNGAYPQMMVLNTNLSGYTGAIAPSNTGSQSYTPFGKAEMVALPNANYAMAYWASGASTWMFGIYNNSGSIVGSTYGPGMLANDGHIVKVITDGTYVYWIWQVGVGNIYVRCCLASNGAGTGSNASVSGLFNSTGLNYVDAFLDGFGYLVVVGGAVGNWHSAVTFDVTKAPTLSATSSFSFYPVSAGGGNDGSVVYGGDFTFLLCSDFGNDSARWLHSYKYASTAIVGVATTSAASGATVSVNNTVATIPLTPLIGLVPRNFTHTGTAGGLNGTLYPNSLIVQANQPTRRNIS